MSITKQPLPRSHHRQTVLSALGRLLPIRHAATQPSRRPPPAPPSSHPGGEGSMTTSPASSMFDPRAGRQRPPCSNSLHAVPKFHFLGLRTARAFRSIYSYASATKSRQPPPPASSYAGLHVMVPPSRVTYRNIAFAFFGTISLKKHHSVTKNWGKWRKPTKPRAPTHISSGILQLIPQTPRK